MPMGTTGTVHVTPEMINNALSAIEEYETATRDLYTRVDNIVAGLIPSNFSGSAADGFNFFYTDKIQPATGEGVQNIIAMLKNITEGISSAIPAEGEGLDDQLAEENRK